MTKNSAADTALKGQLKATSAADEKVKKEQAILNRAYTTESAGRTAKMRYGKLAEKIGTTQAGKIMDLLERVEAKGSKHNIWKIIDNWIGEK